MLGVLVFTGLVSSGWRLFRALPGRGTAAAPDPATLRLDAVRQLLWTILLIGHFVFIEVLAESREVSQTLAIAGSVAGGLCLIAALVALASCIHAEKALG